jgi:hypothetical protein
MMHVESNDPNADSFHAVNPLRLQSTVDGTSSGHDEPLQRSSLPRPIAPAQLVTRVGAAPAASLARTDVPKPAAGGGAGIGGAVGVTMTDDGSAVRGANVAGSARATTAFAAVGCVGVPDVHATAVSVATTPTAPAAPPPRAAVAHEPVPRQRATSATETSTTAIVPYGSPEDTASGPANVTIQHARVPAMRGAHVRINLFLDRVRQKVHRDHQRLAHLVGLVLALFSICYVVLLAWEVLCGHSRHAASSAVYPLAIASVVLHIILGLRHGDVVRIRIGVTAHVVVQACDAVIHAVDRCLAADVPNAAYHLVWVLVVYPFSLRVLWRLFCAMRKFPQNKRNHAAEVSLLAFATVVPLVLYLSFNSIACMAFTPAASITCETRMTVNKAVVLSLAITVMLPVYTTLNPVTSIQAICCDLTPNEWILSFFAGGLLLGTPISNTPSRTAAF